mmetsp:Transcript_7697/g.8707  ORF Transcript_7697/g.8707 Transcript_7697/m.8707 type:complete len:123 (+) Transcript_7697:350-718(+)
MSFVNPNNFEGMSLNRRNNNVRLNQRNVRRARDLERILINLATIMSLEQQSSQQPASQQTIENLKEVEISKEDYEENKETGEINPPNCAICVDSIEDQAVKLKCTHLYHKECIVQWIQIHHI